LFKKKIIFLGSISNNKLNTKIWGEDITIPKPRSIDKDKNANNKPLKLIV
jgi:hypothetical protein